MRKISQRTGLIVFFLFFHLAPLSYCQELIFSTTPFANPAVIHKRFEPLIAHLSQETNSNITIRIAPNYLAHVNALGTGRADLGFAGPSPYVRVMDKYGGIDLLARFKFIEDKNDKVVFVCREQSALGEIQDLKKKSFVFGDHQSFGSHFMPRWLLHQKGVSLKDLIAYDFAKNHDNVILSVLHGDFDAGGVRLDVFEKYADRQLRVLAGPFPIPPHVLVCRSSLPPALKKKLLSSLLTLKDRLVLDRIDKQLSGFETVEDKEFDFARQVMDFVEAR